MFPLVVYEFSNLQVEEIYKLLDQSKELSLELVTNPSDNLDLTLPED